MIKNRFDLWLILTGIIALVICIPVFSVTVLSFFPSEENTWSHLMDTVLMDYIGNTITLMLTVGLGTLVIGVCTAWLVTAYEFPGRKVLVWALLLPLAIPAYIIANVYVEALEYAGPVQTVLRKFFEWRNAGDYWFPEVRSLGGAATMMTMVLYPYVYMLSRAAFLSQKESLINASRLAGKSNLQTFFQVVLPLARPGIALGVILVLMETIADFGTVEFFAVDTFTRGIYNVWLGMYDTNGAARLAVALLFFILILVYFEKQSRHRQRYHQSGASSQTLRSRKLSFMKSITAFLACSFPVILGFILPFTLLIKWSFQNYPHRYIETFWGDLFNSLTLAGTASILAVLLAIMLAYGTRLSDSKSLSFLTKIASMGYALPGPIIALGVLVPFAYFDNSLDLWMTNHFNVSTGLILSGTVFAIIFAYIIRFLAVSFGAVEAGLGKISFNMDEAAQSLGKNRLMTLVNVHVPLMKGSVLTALILVFVDGLKELPATLMLQPFNYSTLATRVFEYASDQKLQESAPWSVAIVLTGILPVILLSLSISQKRH